MHAKHSVAPQQADGKEGPALDSARAERPRRVALACVLLIGATAFAETPAEISRKAKERGALNLVGLKAELKLVTTNAEGASKEQVLMSASKIIEGKNKALARFSAPAGVAGVAVLTTEGEPGKPDDVKLYLPKLKRVRAVAPSDRGKAFMDTDFAYADIVSNGTKDDAVSQLPNEKIEGRDCFVLVAKGDASSQYVKVQLWVDVQTYVPMRVDYFDGADSVLKRYVTVKLKAFQDRTIAAESEMTNLKTKSKTHMTVMKLEPSTLTDDEFTERALERG